MRGHSPALTTLFAAARNRYNLSALNHHRPKPCLNHCAPDCTHLLNRLPAMNHTPSSSLYSFSMPARRARTAATTGLPCRATIRRVHSLAASDCRVLLARLARQSCAARLATCTNVFWCCLHYFVQEPTCVGTEHALASGADAFDGQQ
eukprot:GHRQ01029223.1.p1 GENE.GHRQ01029223.1~~GHRQ01029223.1.p1  ORF type:complete len:148 (-),score=11.71 GHRQ01029223.1:151-594(-)